MISMRMKRYVIDSYLVALAKHAYEYPLFLFCRNRSRTDATGNGLEHTSKKNIDSESLGGLRLRYHLQQHAHIEQGVSASIGVRACVCVCEYPYYMSAW